MGLSIGPTIGIKGESEYRSALRRIISETKTLNTETEKVASTFSKYDSALTRNKQAHEILKAKISSTETSINAMKDALSKAEKKYEDNVTKLNNAVKSYEKYKDATEVSKSEVQAMEKEVSKANTAVSKSGIVVEEWKQKINDAETQLNSLNNELDNLPSNFDVVSEKIQTFGDGLADFGKNLTTYVTTPLAAIGVASTKSAGEFQDGMAKIYTIAKESAVPMSVMRDQLLDLSNATGYSASELAESTYQAVSASVKTEDAVEFVEEAAKLARAGFLDTTGAVDVLTTAINAYGYDVSDAAHISDVLLKTQNDGKTIVAELAETMGTVIPTAAAYNVSLEDLSTAYVMMTKQGINTARTTTFLNAMFTELERESSDVANILEEETGKSFGGLMAEGNSLGDVLGILYNHVDQDGEAFARLWGNVRAGRGGLALVNMGVDAFNEELQRVTYSTGQVDKALDTLETPALQAKKAINQLKNTSIEIGETLINSLYPIFEKVINKIKDMTEWFSGLSEEEKENIVKMGMIAAAAGPVITVIGKLTSGIPAMIKGFNSASIGLQKFGISLADSNAFMGTAVAKIGAYLPQIAAVTGGYVLLGAAAKKMQDDRLNRISEEYGMQDAWQSSIDKLTELRDAYAVTQESVLEDLTNTQLRISTAQELIDKYNSLIDSNGNIIEGNELLAESIIGQLAEALGIEYDQVVDLIEENGKFGESIQNNIADIKARAEMAAYEEMYTEAIHRKIQAEQLLEEQEKNLTEAQNNTKIAQDNYNKALDDYNKYYNVAEPNTYHYKDALDDATWALSNAKAAENDLTTAVSETSGEVEDAINDMSFYEGKISGQVEQEIGQTAYEIRNGGSEVINNAQDVARRTENGMNIDLDGTGYNAVYGLANSINNNGYLAEQAASSLGYRTRRALDYALEVNSPSKATARTGGYFVAGFNNAIEDGIRKVKETAAALGYAAAGELSMTAYVPNSYGETVTNNKSVTAPMTFNINVAGNVEDPTELARNLADEISNILNRENEVFA